MPAMNGPMKKSVSRFTFHVFISQVNHRISVILILCLIVSFGCSDDPEVDTDAAKKGQRDGWAAYDKGDFSPRTSDF